jgi:hypothetical protein
VAVPFFTTGSKTREQFSSSADMQAAAAAARDMHSRRVAEAEAAAEEAELRLDLEAEDETRAQVSRETLTERSTGARVDGTLPVR